MKRSRSLDPLALSLLAAWQPVGSLYLWLLWGLRTLGGKQAFAEPSLAVLLGMATIAVVVARLAQIPSPHALRLLVFLALGVVVVCASAAGISPLGFLGALIRGQDWELGLSLLLVLSGSLLVVGWGLRVSAAEIAREGVAKSLWLSSGSVLVLFLLEQSFPAVLPREMLVPVLLIFLSGTAGLALANFAGARPGDAHGLVPPGLDRYWAQTVGAVMVLLVLAGFALTGWGGTRGFAQIVILLAVLLAAVFVGLSWVIVAFGVVLFFLLYPFFQSLRRLLGTVNLPTPAPAVPAATPVPAPVPLAVGPLWVIALQAGGYLLAISILVAFVLSLFLLKEGIRTSRFSPEEETRESVFSASLLGQQITRLLRRGRRTPQPILPLFSELPLTSDARTQIRRAYRGLLSWAARNGRPRKPPETAQQYGQALARGFASRGALITDLTDLYTPARYGRAQSTPEQARRAEELRRLLEREETLSPPQNPPSPPG